MTFCLPESCLRRQRWAKLCKRYRSREDLVNALEIDCDLPTDDLKAAAMP